MEIDEVITFIRELFQTEDAIPLHAPQFSGKEKAYLLDCIDSTFVSSVGRFVDEVEHCLAEYTGAGYAVATVNGTAALHIALLLAGVKAGERVITQPLTFVATCNAIRYCGADPLFVDVDRDTLGLSPQSLRDFLQTSCVVRDGVCIERASGATIRACLPMHTFGHPCRIDEIRALCDAYSIVLVEDAAESLGSRHQGAHTGTIGRLGVLSFNGNKVITAGGGGCILTDDGDLARRANHLTTTAKQPHRWEYLHDEVGYNYRMPNLNAALLLAQLEQLDDFLTRKRQLATRYQAFFAVRGISFVVERAGCRSNYWLNAVILPDGDARDRFLQQTNDAGVMTRPVWRLMHQLPMFADAQRGDLANAEWLAERVVNLPSSVPA